MASTVDELSISYTEDGIEVVKELDKEILSKGAWSTVIFKYQDWNRSKGEYGPDKYTIRRYQKRNGEYMPKSKFNISSRDQAKSIIAKGQGPRAKGQGPRAKGQQYDGLKFFLSSRFSSALGPVP